MGDLTMTDKEKKQFLKWYNYTQIPLAFYEIQQCLFEVRIRINDLEEFVTKTREEISSFRDEIVKEEKA